MLLLNDRHARAACPDLELVRSRGAEGIRGADENIVTFVLYPLRELANGGGLAYTVYSDDHQHVGFDRCIDSGFASHTVIFGMLQDV